MKNYDVYVPHVYAAHVNVAHVGTLTVMCICQLIFGHHRYLRQFVIPTSVVCSVIFGLWWDHVNLTLSSNLFHSLNPGGIAILGLLHPSSRSSTPWTTL